MSEKVKGKLTVETDDKKLYAHLRYTPGGPARSWGEEEVDKLLDSEDVIHGIDDDAISEMIIAIPNLEEETLFENIATHTPPESPRNETLELIPRKTFSYVEGKLESQIAKAPAPVITKTVEEEILIDEFTEEKKGLLGKLGKDKGPEKEIVKKNVRVKVDPRVLKYGYIQKNELIGTLLPPSSGKPGMNIAGESIPAPKIETKPFKIGKNIIKKEKYLYAELSGIYRIGEDWIDIFPFQAPLLKFKLSPDKSNCFLTYHPADKSFQQPSLDDIRNRLEEEKYPLENALPPEDILQMIEESIESGNPIEQKSVSLGLDCEIQVEINPSSTRADLYLKKHIGSGTPISLKTIGATLSKARIPGIDVEKLKQQIIVFNKSSEKEIRLLLREGIRPERGKDKEIKYTAPLFSDEDCVAAVARIQEQPEIVRGTASLRDFPIETITAMAKVKKDDVLFSVAGGSEGKPGKDIFGKPIPGISGNEPQIQFYENISFIEGKATAKIEGVLDIFEDKENNSYKYRIRKHKDAVVSVSIAENQMSASISVYPHSGSGRPLDKEMILESLEKSEVVKGIREDMITEAIEKYQAGDFVADFVVAEGRLPSGSETTLKLLVNIDPVKKNSVNIKAGEIFGEKSNLVKDESSGFNVMGETLSEEDEESNEIEIGAFIREEEHEEIIKLIAEKSGRLFYDGKSLFIKDKMVIDGDISLKTGNVKFPGSIEVKGSILSRVSVVAGENISVNDVVQDALVSADGNLTIGKGIKGGRKAVIRNQGDLTLGFAEEANLLSVGDINLNKALMLCSIKCNKKIKGESGTKIIGGVIKSKEGLTIDTIGSERGAKTTISFGQDYLIENQIETLNNELTKLRDYIGKIDGIMEKMEETGNKAKLMEARKKKLKTLKMIEKKNLRLFLLKEKYEAHFPSEIIIRDKVYPGVIIESHGRTIEFHEIEQAVKIEFDPSNGSLQQKNIH